LTSSIEILPPGPEPVTRFISTPISRANLLDDGAAGAGLADIPVCISTRTVFAEPVSFAAIAATAGFVSSFLTAGAATAGELFTAAADAPASALKTTCPTEILSPSFIYTSRTFPDMFDGTSMVALSVSLGTDGFGSSEGRKELRDFFEVDHRYVALGALYALAKEGRYKMADVKKAMKDLDINPEKLNPHIS